MHPRVRLQVPSPAAFGSSCAAQAAAPLRSAHACEKNSSETTLVRCLSARTAFDALLTTRSFPKGSHVMMSGESPPNAVFPLFNGLLLHIYPAINIPDMVPPGCGFTLSIWFKLCVCFRHTLSGKSALVAHVAQEL